MSQLVKVGLPSHMAENARVARRVQQILEQRDAAFNRIEADFRVRLKALATELEQEVSNAVATADTDAVA
jgi:hypothetical protein